MINITIRWFLDLSKITEQTQKEIFIKPNSKINHSGTVSIDKPECEITILDVWDEYTKTLSSNIQLSNVLNTLLKEPKEFLWVAQGILEKSTPKDAEICLKKLENNETNIKKISCNKITNLKKPLCEYITLKMSDGKKESPKDLKYLLYINVNLDPTKNNEYRLIY